MIILLGNMLFPNHSALPLRQMPVFMAEDFGLCTHANYHKHKLILYLAAMRHHRDDLQQQGVLVEYWPLDAASATMTYEEKLLASLEKFQPQSLHTYQIEDHWFRDRLQSFCDQHQLPLITYESPLFLTSTEVFQVYRRRYKRLFMGDFYKFQRQRLNILIQPDGKPVGDRWSYDEDNRKPLPKKPTQGWSIPTLTIPTPSPHVQAVKDVVDHYFPTHPGHSRDFWLPVTRTEALHWLDQFLVERFQQFGPYEDALSTQEPFVFHSVLSPLINLGLLTPHEVVAAALESAATQTIPLNSLEGFIRQVIGWREYIRGVYHEIGETQRQSNHLGHLRGLTQHWHQGNMGLFPLDHVIQQVNQRGWAHHIERLMVVSNAMLLTEIHPNEVFQWFLDYFVDGADWVMVPNIYGMGQFADGGQMMTKPYISGSNYLRKMGNYPKTSASSGNWEEIWDGLYWRFVDRNRALFSQNPRMGFMLKTLEKMELKRRERLMAIAAEFIENCSLNVIPSTPREGGR
jgi:deoxyribodipyrimidine photolyase-related protein